MGEQQRILITGATSGIGRGLVEHYADDGHIVAAVARRADLLNDLADRYPSVVPCPMDVTDGPGLERVIGRFAEEQGGLDLVYANAGIGQRTTADSWEPERARRIGEINVVGSTNTIAPAVSIMIPQGRGHIVGVSSLAGQCPLPCSAAYGASKAWMIFYLRSLAMDLEPTGIRFTIVMPGHVPTAMVDGEKAGLLTEGAKRAAALIATRVARGDFVIRFPRRTAVLARIAGFAPAGVRARAQRRRLEKRKSARDRGP